MTSNPSLLATCAHPPKKGGKPWIIAIVLSTTALFVGLAVVGCFVLTAIDDNAPTVVPPANVGEVEGIHSENGSGPLQIGERLGFHETVGNEMLTRQLYFTEVRIRETYVRTTVTRIEDGNYTTTSIHYDSEMRPSADPPRVRSGQTLDWTRYHNDRYESEVIDVDGREYRCTVIGPPGMRSWMWRDISLKSFDSGVIQEVIELHMKDR